MSLLARIRAAVIAFKDPCLIGEALQMAGVARTLAVSNRIAVIRADASGKRFWVRVESLNYHESESIKNALGIL